MTKELIKYINKILYTYQENKDILFGGKLDYLGLLSLTKMLAYLTGKVSSPNNYYIPLGILYKK